jgi:hypothetical protein
VDLFCGVDWRNSFDRDQLLMLLARHDDRSTLEIPMIAREVASIREDLRKGRLAGVSAI